MRRYWLLIAVLPVFFLPGCARAEKNAGVQGDAVSNAVTENSAATPAKFAVQPWAILQAGTYPLWFQLVDGNPVLLETIDDAVFSSALIPWPLAPHIRFFIAHNDDLLMAVNRFGFMCLSRMAELRDESAGLYIFSGGDFWQHYTVDAFFMSGGMPAALLYRNDRFYDSGQPLPSPRMWTFNFDSPAPVPLFLPSLEKYPPEEGWDIDGLRRGADSRWYFRAAKKNQSQPKTLHLASDDLMQPGGEVALGVFMNAARPEALSTAPEPLKQMLETVFAETGIRAAAVVSPLFERTRNFALDNESPSVPAFFSGDSLLIALPNGSAWFSGINAGPAASIRRFSLPPLPESFIYTGIGLVGNTIFASWEEQEGYSIGAAGFMVVRCN